MFRNARSQVGWYVTLLFQVKKRDSIYYVQQMLFVQHHASSNGEGAGIQGSRLLILV